MSKARGGLEKTSDGFRGAEHAVSSFAAKGLTTAIPALEGFEHKIGMVITKLEAGSGALKLFGQAALVVGGTLAVAALTQYIEEYIRFGDTMAHILEKMKEAREEEEKFVAARGRAVALQLGLMQQLAQKDTELKQLVRSGAGDEQGAEAEALAGRLQAIEFERKAREASIFSTIAMGERRNAALATSERIWLTDRTKANETYAQAVIKIDDARQAKQIKAWQDETTALIGELKTRLERKKAFEAQLGQGAAGLGIEVSAASGHKAANDFGDFITKAARDQNFLERSMSQTDALASREQLLQGIIARGEALKQTYAGFPSVIDAIDAKLNAVQWGNFGLQVEKARGWVDAWIARNRQLETSLVGVGVAVDNLPAGLTAASAEVKKLTADFNDLAWAAFGAARQIRNVEEAARDAAGSDASDS
jgi:hypothetical protein